MEHFVNSLVAKDFYAAAEQIENGFAMTEEVYTRLLAMNEFGVFRTFACFIELNVYQHASSLYRHIFTITDVLDGKILELENLAEWMCSDRYTATSHDYMNAAECGQKIVARKAKMMDSDTDEEYMYHIASESFERLTRKTIEFLLVDVGLNWRWEIVPVFLSVRAQPHSRIGDEQASAIAWAINDSGACTERIPDVIFASPTPQHNTANGTVLAANSAMLAKYGIFLNGCCLISGCHSEMGEKIEGYCFGHTEIIINTLAGNSCISRDVAKLIVSL